MVAIAVSSINTARRNSNLKGLIITTQENEAGGFCVLRSAFCVSLRPFQQRTNTSCYLAIPTHGFTVVLSVFRGTPPAKPLKCKSVSIRLGARIRPAWTHHTGGTPRHSCDRFRLALSDIIKTSYFLHSQFHFPFVLMVHRYIFRQQKTLLTFR